MERLTVRVKEGNRKDECFIPGNKNAIEKVEYICEGERWESEEYKGKAVDKLAEYEDLEEQNRLLKLSCAVGDTVYIVKGGEVLRNYVVQIHISQTEAQTFFSCYDDCFCIEEIGKTVFLAREEAEAALKGLERGKGE